MQSPPNGGGAASPSAHPIRLLSVKLGQTWIVRFLGSYRFLGTHWKPLGKGRGTSVLCSGPETCQAATHALKFTAKYYAPVQVWMNSEKVWRAHALEITENLERSLRDRNLRGEIWSLSREDRGAGSRSPVEGSCVDTIEEAYLPSAFDMDRWLCNFFRVPRLPRDMKSPIPERPVVYDEPGEPPMRCLSPETAAAVQKLEEDRAHAAALLRQHRQQRWPGAKSAEKDQADVDQADIPSNANGNGKH